jgi:hut operon positive regulator
MERELGIGTFGPAIRKLKRWLSLRQAGFCSRRAIHEDYTREETTLALASEGETDEVVRIAREKGYQVCKGRVGAMDSAKIFAAVETAAKREGIIKNMYREEHAIYHSALEAYSAICRGQEGLGSILRTVGLVFSIVRGPRVPGDMKEDEWIAVMMYGYMGAPTKGYEHEVLGLGINPV